MEHVIGVVVLGGREPPRGVHHVLIEREVEEGVSRWEELG